MQTTLAKITRIRVDGVLKNALETGRQRLLFTGFVACLSFAALAVRLVDLAFASVDPVTRAANMPDGKLSFARADIVDRNGILLATNLETASLYANPKIMLDAEKAAKVLTKIFPELPYKKLRERLAPSKGFVWIKRNLTPEQQYRVNNLGIPGLFFQREEKRVYPHGALSSHVLGFVDVDGKGIAGIEQTLDRQLNQGFGKGAVLGLTVDVRVQGILHEELRDSIAKFRARGGAGIVMDAHNGEVLGLASLPDFNPNLPSSNDPDALFNRATLGLYEMGSTFKMFTLAMALDTGTVNLRSTYDISEPIRISRFIIRDHDPIRRRATVPEIFMHSSNIGAAKIAVDVGGKRQKNFLSSLHLLEKSGIELPETAGPLYPDRWGEISAMTVAFGHGIAVSPLHMASAMSALINGGVYYPPTLLKHGNTPKGEPVIKKSTSEIMRRLLHLVVSKGTGGFAKVPGYLVGGKTGTAEKPNAGRYNRKAHITSFVGAFPMNDPKYIVLVLLDEPQATKETYGWMTAGWNSAPTAGKIIARIGPLLGVQPVDEQSPEIQKAMHVEYELGKKEVAGF